MTIKFETIRRRLVKQMLFGRLNYLGTYEDYHYYTLPEWRNSCMVRFSEEETRVALEAAQPVNMSAAVPVHLHELPGSLKYLVNSVKWGRKRAAVYPNDEPVKIPSSQKGGSYMQTFVYPDGSSLLAGIANKLYLSLVSEHSIICYHSDVRCFTIHPDSATWEDWEILIMPIIRRK